MEKKTICVFNLLNCDIRENCYFELRLTRHSKVVASSTKLLDLRHVTKIEGLLKGEKVKIEKKLDLASSAVFLKLFFLNKGLVNCLFVSLRF